MACSWTLQRKATSSMAAVATAQASRGEFAIKFERKSVSLCSKEKVDPVAVDVEQQLRIVGTDHRKGVIASGKLEKGERDSNSETFHRNPAG